jgi:O-antigen ligase
VLPSQWLSYAGERTTGSLQSVSVYTTTLIFGGLILFQQALEMRSGWKRSLFILAILSSIYAIFISFSRASWLAGVLVLMMVFLRHPRVSLRLMLVVLPIGLLVTGTLFVNQLEFAGQRLYSPGSTQTALSRLPVLVAAYRMFEEKPIFGWGYDNFDRFDRTYQSRFADLVNPDEKDLTSHNTYLTILAEQGIVGLALFLAPLVWLLYRSLQVSSRLSRSGLMGREMLYLLWLVIMAYFVVNNFAPMGVVFGLGLNWITLGFIAQIIQANSPVEVRV